MSAARVYSFPPIADSGSRILILGSMPGTGSLRAGEYYAHPRNAFWRIMAELVGADFDKPYAERTKILCEQGIAVWDVFQSCVRDGSLDTAISQEIPNDFASFFAKHRQIAHVGLNGGKAAAAFAKFAVCPPHVKVVRLPSSSPAYTMRFEQKCAAWRAGLPI